MVFVRLALLVLPLSLSLAGCGPGYQWAKPGITPALADADYDRCRYLTEREVDAKYWSQFEWLRFNQFAGRTRGPSRFPPALRYSLERDRLQSDRDFDRVRLMRVCMEGNGYQLVPIEPKPG